MWRSWVTDPAGALRAVLASCKTARVQPGPDEIRAALERILASAGFAGSARLGRFLRFVVERSLAGEAARLKEYSIGMEVFDRTGEYDPRVDSIVRVEAGRLRTKLEEYYATAGSGDAVRIALNKGSYAPSFETRQPATAPAAPASPDRRPVLAAGAVIALIALATMVWFDRGNSRAAGPSGIAVLPFFPYGGAAADPETEVLRDRLTTGVIAALVKSRTIEVAPAALSARFRDPYAVPEGVADLLGAELVMMGRLTMENGQVRIDAVMMDRERTRKFWAESFTGPVSAPDALAKRIADSASIAAANEIARAKASR
jgi:TolB-like protein